MVDFHGLMHVDAYDVRGSVKEKSRCTASKLALSSWKDDFGMLVIDAQAAATREYLGKHVMVDKHVTPHLRFVKISQTLRPNPGASLGMRCLSNTFLTP